MGFFENLGRKVGKFTHEAKEAAADEANYACEDCGERFYTEHEECPACGGENVRELEPAANAEADDAEEDDAAEPDETAADRASEPADVSDDGTNRE